MMDIEPIYCAEQIKIPPTLADALKTYTKAVIRAQPENILEFSVSYFTKLANLSNQLVVDSTPELPQITQVYALLSKLDDVSPKEFVEACSSTGIAPEIVEKAFAVDSSGFDKLNAIVLLLTMVSTSLENLFELIFQVMSSEHHMPVSDIMSIIDFLATRDESVTNSMKENLASGLEGKEVASLKELTTIMFPSADS